MKLPVISTFEFEGLGKRDRTIHRVLNKLFQRRDIVIGDKLYLRRWYVSGLGTRKQVFLHHIVRPDEGRELHDHPFDFKTRILSGGYYEQFLENNTAGVCTINGRWAIGGDTLDLDAEHTHRIDKVLDGTYTLVTATAARREWGFYTNQRRADRWTSALAWVPWREYLGTPDAPEWPEDHVLG